MTNPTFGVTRPPRAFVAAAKQYELTDRKKVGKPWQETLWDIYTNLGPVHYGMTFKQSAAQRIAYFVAEQDEKQDEPIPSENDQAIEALERLGDVQEIVGQFIIQENVAGEGWLVGFEEDEPFDVWSSLYLQKRRGDRDKTQPDYTLRIWRPHPNNPDDPDAPLRSVQAQCEQLLLLNDHISSTAMSRIPAGLLAIASEFSFPGSPENSPETGANADNDPFMEEMIQIATLAITDPASAARVAPNIIRGPYEYIKDGIRFIDMSREIDATFAEMREELLRQIAGGINLPAEILTGLADLNHWSLWGVDESTAKHHVDPDVLAILQGLTEGYLWPYLEESGMAPDVARRFKVWRDYTDLTARPLTIEQAERLFDKGVITAVDLRRIANLGEEDELNLQAGDLAVMAETVGILFRAGFEAEAILDALGLPSIAHTGAAPVTIQSEDAIEDTPGEGTLPGPPAIPITAAAALDLSGLERVDATATTQIIEATEAAFTRALERAGAKVRVRAKKDAQVMQAIKAVPNVEVTRTLGGSRLERFQLSPDELLPADTFNHLEDRLRVILGQAQGDTANIFEQLTTVRYPEEDTDDSAIALFIAALFVIAQSRLFTDDPGIDPAETGEFSDDIAPAQLVVDLLTRAGGGDPDLPDSARGLALGQRTRAAFRDNGYRIESQTWKWAYYRTPRTPYEPHLNLAGQTVLSRDDPRLDGYYPGDHRFCTCELVPAVLPAS